MFGTRLVTLLARPGPKTTENTNTIQDGLIIQRQNAMLRLAYLSTRTILVLLEEP
jgi:hypothetical protein